MKRIVVWTAALVMLALAVACSGEGQSAGGASASGESVAATSGSELLLIYFYDDDVEENVLSAIDDLEERFGDRIEVWCVETALNPRLCERFEVQGAPLAVLCGNVAGKPLNELTVTTRLDKDIDRAALTQAAVAILDP